MKAYSSQYTLFETESRLCEISLAIPVPEPLLSKVRSLTSQAAELAGQNPKARHEVYIPVCSFLLFEHLAYDMFTHFRDTLEQIPAMTIFPGSVIAESSPRSLHLSMDAGYSFISILRNVNETREKLRIRTNYSQVQSPRISLFRGYSASDFQEARNELLGKEITGSFFCDELHLIKFDLLSRKHSRLSSFRLRGSTTSRNASASASVKEDLFL